MKICKGQLDMVMAAVIFGLALAIMVLIYVINLGISSQTLSYTEISSQTNTALYVILNNNDLTPKTIMPFKDILAIAISQGKTSIGSEVTIDYNGKQEAVVLKDILDKNLEKMGIKEYKFYVLWNSQEILTHTTSSYKTNSSEETEYISVPSDDSAKRIAAVVLKISRIELDDKLNICPESSDFKCYPRLTCTAYNGKCLDDKYACGSLECCCEKAEI